MLGIDVNLCWAVTLSVLKKLSSEKGISLADTIKGFKMVLNGELDDLPEQSFYLVGNIDQAIAKAETLK